MLHHKQIRAAILSVLSLLAFSAHDAVARDVFVNPATGDDKASGLAETAGESAGPVKTIARAIKLAGPGDTVHLAPAVYKESALFGNRSGEPGKPIVLDGHGATLDGSEALNPSDWEQVSPGLYRCDHLIKMQDFILTRWFFIFDGRMNHMGRTSKGAKAPLKKPAELQVDEWTWVESEKAFFIRIDPAKKLADCHIAAPLRSVGVGISGKCQNLIIRNLTSTHVHNDGFNIHGFTRDVVFENIGAIECGDDGFSAHEDCSVRVDGFVSIGNSTGICNIGSSASENNHVLIKDCIGYDLFFLDGGHHSVSNSVIISSSQSAVVVTGRAAENLTCTLKMDNVLIRRIGRRAALDAAKKGVLEADHVTLLGLGIRVAGTATVRHSIVAGEPDASVTVMAGASWQTSDNLYDLRSLTIDKTSYTDKTFVDYQRATGQDAGSACKAGAGADAISPVPGAPGADLTKLPTIPVSMISPTPIFKVTTAPVIDGSLDDECWKKAVPIAANYLYAGDGKRTDPAPMVVRFAWDERYLYIGYEVLDTDLVTVPTGREAGPAGNRRPTSEEYAPEKSLDLAEFFISLGSERAFWEVHHTAGNQLNNHWCELAPPEVLAKVAKPSIKDLSIKRDGYISDDGPATVARAVQLTRRADGTPSTVNKSDDIDVGYTGEIRLPWAGLGMPASRRRRDGTYDLTGFELPMLAVILNGNGGKAVYHSSGPGLPKVMFHFSAALWPRYVLIDSAKREVQSAK